MVQYTVLIPQHDTLQALGQQLRELDRFFEFIALPYEVICIDDGSEQANLDVVDELLRSHESLRVLRFDQPRGLSAALSAGIAAARGEVVIAIAPGNQYGVRQILTLISRLSRGDLVFGRRTRTGLAQAWRRMARIPRWLLLGLDVRDPDCLFWAARREAIAGLTLTRGMFRYLPTLVAMRGFRVSEVAVDDRAAAAVAPYEWPNPIDLFAVWWLKVRGRAGGIRELHAGDSSAPRLKIIDLPERRPAFAAPQLASASGSMPPTQLRAWDRALP